MPRKKNITQVRLVGDNFVNYLEERKMIKTWPRPQLRLEFDNFMHACDGPKAGFSSVLFQLARFPPKHLRVHAGHVIFKGTVDYRRTTYTSNFENVSEEIANIRRAIKAELCKTVSKKTLLKNGDTYSLKITCHPEEYEEFDGVYVCEMGDNEEDYTMVIQNRSDFDVTLKACLFLRKNPAMALSDEVGCTLLDKPRPVIIKSKAVYAITVLCKTVAQVGSYFGDVFFQFQNPIFTNQHFIVMRHLRCVRSNEIIKMLQPTSPYKSIGPKIDYGDNLVTIFSDKTMIKAQDNVLNLSRNLPDAQVPPNVNSIVGILQSESGVTKSGDFEIKELIESNLTKENYQKKFLFLMQCEELQAKIDIRQYDLHGVTLAKDNYNFRLQVPGLAEKRPSVLRGDVIYVCPVQNVMVDKNKTYRVIGNKRYQGRVIKVELDHVFLVFHRDFERIFIGGLMFNVFFTFNRLPLKLQYRAITELNMNIIGKKIFPVQTSNFIQPINMPIMMYDGHIESNEQQNQAVKSIVFKGNPCPYIIYGPPGTGKTVTMVESIKQVLKLNPHHHVLICAPSNSACDLLVERLLNHVSPGKIFRMYAMSHNNKDMPQIIKDKRVANYRDGDYYYPSKTKLCEYNVIATTLITAGRLASADFDRNHFNYIFIDEAGHAVEPECIIAIEGLLSQNGKVVLAGDPNQLGPILRSKISQKYGLVMSYLERLMEFDIYKPDSRLYYNSTVITKLINNYRSHKAILDVPNELFYDNELIECADEMSRKAYCDWEYLPMGAKTNDFPIIFHGVEGKDQREANSPSYFNPEEASIVYDYLLKLLNTKKSKILDSEIGIIAPYRKQVEKIRKMIQDQKARRRDTALLNVELRRLKVGSVEEFQGQERKVIIISTVRSRAEHLPDDDKFKLGFLRNPKRFNVAITRAKALLIVVGNPYILCHDYHWKKFIKHVTDNGGYTGIPYEFLSESSEDEDDPIDLCTQRANTLGIEEAMEQLEISEVQVIDPPWRNEH